MESKVGKWEGTQKEMINALPLFYIHLASWHEINGRQRRERGDEEEWDGEVPQGRGQGLLFAQKKKNKRAADHTGVHRWSEILHESSSVASITTRTRFLHERVYLQPPLPMKGGV